MYACTCGLGGATSVRVVTGKLTCCEVVEGAIQTGAIDGPPGTALGSNELDKSGAVGRTRPHAEVSLTTNEVGRGPRDVEVTRVASTDVFKFTLPTRLVWGTST